MIEIETGSAWDTLLQWLSNNKLAMNTQNIILLEFSFRNSRSAISSSAISFDDLEL